MQSDAVQSALLLEPSRLCTKVLGRLCFYPDPKSLHHYRGHYTREDIQHPENHSHMEKMLQILHAMDICAGTQADGGHPCLIKTDNMHHSQMIRLGDSSRVWNCVTVDT